MNTPAHIVFTCIKIFTDVIFIITIYNNVMIPYIPLQMYYMAPCTANNFIYCFIQINPHNLDYSTKNISS